jgi:hypothetical protein
VSHLILLLSLSSLCEPCLRLDCLILISFSIGADEDFNGEVLVPTLGLPDAGRRCHGPWPPRRGGGQGAGFVWGAGGFLEALSLLSQDVTLEVVSLGGSSTLSLDLSLGVWYSLVFLL